MCQAVRLSCPVYVTAARRTIRLRAEFFQDTSTQNSLSPWCLPMSSFVKSQRRKKISKMTTTSQTMTNGEGEGYSE
jgi:hypothetical protein